MPDAVWYQLRQSRSRPPGLAQESLTRRETYNAALAQFEELMDAARQVTAASKPLPLYYALSQAGRAIVAARADTAPTPGHGLTTGDLRWDDISTLPISPAGAREFQAVAEIVGSDNLPSETPLAALWASLPDLVATPLPESMWPTALSIDFSVEGEIATERSQSVDGYVRVGDWLAPEASLEQAETLLANYPTAADAEIVMMDDAPIIEEHSYYGRGLGVSWQADGDTYADRLALIERVAPPYGHRPAGG